MDIIKSARGKSQKNRKTKNGMDIIKSATVLIFLAFFSTIPAALGSSSSPSPSVIIIGAGMSGLSAAKTLHDRGVDNFLILEATPRIGGRIRKTDFAGHVVELGANWLVGVGGRRKNPIFELGKQINLKCFQQNYSNISSNIYKEEGGLYAKDEVEAVERMADEIEAFGSNLSDNLTKGMDYYDGDEDDDDTSVLGMQRLYKRVPVTPLEMIMDYYYFDFEDAEPPSISSLKRTLPRREYEDFGYDSYFVADSRGMEGIVYHFAQQFLSYDKVQTIVDDPRVKLNKIVKEISYSNTSVRVKTEDGSEYTAKAVIVSVSIGVLQSNLITFKPSLPEWKEHAISELSVAMYTKVFFKFRYKFWPTGPGTVVFLYAHKRRGYYPVWQHVETAMPGSNIIFVLVTHEEATRIEHQADEETEAEAMEVLRKIFGNDIPDPEAILVPRWKSDRFYQGCFSNWPASCSEKKYRNIQARVDSVFFTGEHTHPKYYGYVDGAYYAGKRTGKEVVKYLQKNASPGYCKKETA